ncbi:hydrogenase maturation factor [Orenia metallireducens]|jgi:hydrogenase maturation factor|uniref:Hydrogenase maturation factor n=1 Tax=Orenia metallireducens TaxID=1413210 RepID=A0A285F2Z1_9FIRM|nr:AIR synthase family protein [Orenia metallireducens]PRX34791.1 hydrogenase maturation factor [Orenia metallireducens]SNY05642.1 Hydrogenase maturation factor [Orenia metallireducens]
MKAGKIDIGNLKELILDKISASHQDVLVRPKIGEDSAVIDFGEFVAVMSTDPITGVKEGMGSLAVNVACNDIAANGAKAIGIQQALLIPPTTSKEEIVAIIQDINQAAQDLGIDILGGHTEITDIVTQPLVVCTAIGKTTKDKYVTSSGAKVGDDIVVTKWSGLEGTAILANDYYQKLVELGIDEGLLKEGQGLIKDLSVISEGLIGAEFGVNAMHDVTEGGLYGSVFELSIAAEVGFELEENLVPLHPATKAISDKLKINPYQLIGSGMMILTSERGEELVKELELAGIKATIIGKIVEKKRVVNTKEGQVTFTNAPQDELWRFLAEN